jgi:DNA polymerase III epsilon subunit-like protein
VTEELWISIDVETSGPTPSTGSLLAIGACLVERPEISFAVDFKPSLHMPWSDEAERIHGLSRRYLERAGREPAEAMRDFVDWVEKQAGAARPVFVAFNATFDWMWVADYAWRYVGRNPFGISGLDIKALYFGRHLAEVRRWAATTSDDVRRRYPVDLPHTHLALDDAREQAAMCRAILAAS